MTQLDNATHAPHRVQIVSCAPTHPTTAFSPDFLIPHLLSKSDFLLSHLSSLLSIVSSRTLPVRLCACTLCFRRCLSLFICFSTTSSHTLYLTLTFSPVFHFAWPGTRYVCSFVFTCVSNISPNVPLLRAHFAMTSQLSCLTIEFLISLLQDNPKVQQSTRSRN